MTIAELVGKAQTVLGPIDAENLGITLPHEHLLAHGAVWFVEPQATSEKLLAHQPVTMEILGWLQYHPANNVDNINMRPWGEEVAIREALRYKLAGGGTIVDQTNVGIGRDPLALQRISRATGLNVIMGSGYYIGASHPPQLASKTEEEIAEEIVRDITVGVGDTGVRAGIIGEIGCSHPLMDGERKVLRAVAQAQQRTGAPVNIHPGFPHEASPFEIIDVLAEAGGNINRTVISHLDYISTDAEKVAKLAESGCHIEYDLFGRQGHLKLQVGFIDIPSEGQRVEAIKQLIDRGYLNQILVSQDIFFKTNLTGYGGHGYAHILNNIVPLMRAKGIAEEHIHTLLVENPKRLLQFI